MSNHDDDDVYVRWDFNRIVFLLVLCFGKKKTQHEAYEWYDVWNLKREKSEREWKTSYYKHTF